MNNVGYRIAYILLTATRPLNTNEIVDKVGCDRKTVYKNIDALEIAGFCTEITKGNKKDGNYYSMRLNY